MRTLTIFYLNDSEADKAQIAEIMGIYPTFPEDYHRVFSHSILKNDHRNPIQICTSAINKLRNNRNDMRSIRIGDLCQVDQTMLRVATFGLTPHNSE